MNYHRKIYHSTLEINANVIGYYLVITEVSIETGQILASYVYAVPTWAHDWQTEEYKYYHPILN